MFGIRRRRGGRETQDVPREERPESLRDIWRRRRELMAEGRPQNLAHARDLLAANPAALAVLAGLLALLDQLIFGGVLIWLVPAAVLIGALWLRFGGRRTGGDSNGGDDDGA